jgi:hypothetical protein
MGPLGVIGWAVAFGYAILFASKYIFRVECPWFTKKSKA